MLRLRGSILSRLLSSSAASPIPFPLHRLLSAVAPAVSPNPSFAVEEYLVHTCGLTRAQALKASARISRINSPTQPDSVLAFLAGLGLSTADVAAVVAKDPEFLCAGVEKILAPNVTGLTRLGLSHAEIARLVSIAPDCFRRRSIVSNLPFLRECGLDACDIAKLCIQVPWLLKSTPERLQATVACAEGLGVPRGSGMFRHALHAVAFLKKENITAKVDCLKKTLSWSDDEVGIALSKLPTLLGKSKDMLQRKSQFLYNEVGLEPAYIAHRPALLSYSLEGRLKPRYYAVKFLRENGLVKRDPDYFSIAKDTEKVFMKKFICPHKEAAPHLSEDYAAACRGALPTNFRFI